MKITIVILLLANVLTLSVANEVITGKVMNRTIGTPLDSVEITSSIQKTFTKKDGTFKIKVATRSEKLVFKRPGFKDYTFQLTGHKSIKVFMYQQGSQQIPPEFSKMAQVQDTQERYTINGVAPHKMGAMSTAKMYSVAPPPSYNEERSEEYNGITENGFQIVSTKPLSTFSIDVDNASYSNIRRYLNNGQLPPQDAVKIEEMVNYFGYNYPVPKNNEPFAVFQKIDACPWNKNHQLLMMGIQAPKISLDKLPNSNFVFLVDVSGSMNAANKLPLLKSSLKMLVKELRPTDKVAIVTYAGSVGVALPSTSGNQKRTISEAIDALGAGGSTAGAEGLQKAYEIAENNFVKGGNNRIIMATDGDFNVGPSSVDDLKNLITKNRDKGIYISVLGFGMGNYKDNKMEVIAQNGNGNQSYIDNLQEARKVLVNEMSGTLFTIAKDVKIQIEFNASQVYAYRLVGYENRLLNDADFNDDKKDAGEIGAGHTVTVLYEIVPPEAAKSLDLSVDPLKYNKVESNKTNHSNELATLKIRYKKPDEEISKKIEIIISEQSDKNFSSDFTFASAVALFGMQLRNSEYIKQGDLDTIKQLAIKGKGADAYGYRGEFIRLVELAQSLQPLKLDE